MEWRSTMIINYNVSAMIANNALARNDSALSKTLERLSSGYKINHAKDNAAGLAMARRMNAQIEGLSVAGDNTTDGVSIVEIADGALSEVHDMLQRMNELAVKASTGTMCDEDRVMVDQEVQQLKDEIGRVGKTTQFNGQNLLDGSFDLRAYSSSEAISVDYYGDNVPVGKYTISVAPVYDAEGMLTQDTEVTALAMKTPAVVDYDLSQMQKTIKDDVITLTGKDGFELRMTLDKKEAEALNYNINDIELNLTGIGSMTLQIGANEGQTLELRIPPITPKNLGIDKTEMLTEDSATKSIDEIKGAITFVSEIRSALGAYQNRLEHTATNIDVTSENMTSAYSRIMDTDMAKEMTKYSSMQVISQAATAMLAQANERPSQVLQILQ